MSSDTKVGPREGSSAPDSDRTSSAATAQPDNSEPANITKGARVPPRPTTPRPTLPLPHWRIPVSKQLEILRGHVAASGGGTEPVSNATLGDVVGMHQNNVCLPNPF